MARPTTEVNMDFDQAAAYADECEKQRAEEKRKKAEEEARKHEFRVLSDDSVLLNGDEIQTTQGPIPFVRASASRNSSDSVTIVCLFCEGEYIVEVTVRRHVPPVYFCIEVDRDYRQYRTASLEVVAQAALGISRDRATARLSASVGR